MGSFGAGRVGAACLSREEPSVALRPCSDCWKGEHQELSTGSKGGCAGPGGLSPAAWRDEGAAPVQAGGQLAGSSSAGRQGAVLRCRENCWPQAVRTESGLKQYIDLAAAYN